MQWLKRLLGSSSTPSASGAGAYSVRRVTLNDPLVIVSPRIGFLNLLGTSAQPILEEDKAALRPLFASLEESGPHPPVCDVLMLYAHLQNDGCLTGASNSLREIIHKSRAPIVIVAAENEVSSYIATGKRPGAGRANLVMTLNRNGPAFTKFYTQLFGRMFQGKSMAMAWVELAPQIPGLEHENVPGSIFAAEVSHVVFKS